MFSLQAMMRHPEEGLTTQPGSNANHTVTTIGLSQPVVPLPMSQSAPEPPNIVPRRLLVGGAASGWDRASALLEIRGGCRQARESRPGRRTYAERRAPASSF